MTIEEVLSKIRVMLSVESQTETEAVLDETTKVEFADYVLVDGTKVMVEGELTPGNILLVDTGEGNEPTPAPAGLHQTQDNLVIEVDENGVILSVEPIEPETQSEDKTKEGFDGEELLNQISSLITPLNEEIKGLKDKLNNLNTEFSQFKNEPAGKRITNNLEENKKIDASLYEGRLEKLYEIRQKGYKK